MITIFLPDIYIIWFYETNYAHLQACHNDRNLPVNAGFGYEQSGLQPKALQAKVPVLQVRNYVRTNKYESMNVQTWYRWHNSCKNVTDFHVSFSGV